MEVLDRYSCWNWGISSREMGNKSNIDSMTWLSISQFIMDTGMSAMVARCRRMALCSFPCILGNLSVVDENILTGRYWSLLNSDVVKKQWVIGSKVVIQNGSMNCLQLVKHRCWINSKCKLNGNVNCRSLSIYMGTIADDLMKLLLDLWIEPESI